MHVRSILGLSVSGFALAAALPTAAQTTQSAQADPATAAATVESTGEQDVVVTGLRASLAKAQDIKKKSDEIVDSLVAEDIGKFPDVNAIEAVARVHGVQIGRRNDEGFQTLVRGLTQVTTTLNGRESFTIVGRTFALQEFSSDSLAGVDVFKANTAVNLEAGLGGLINVRLRRAFDLPEGLTVAGGVRAQYYDLTKKVDPLANGLISYRWTSGIGDIGMLANVAYAGTKGYNQSVRYDGTFRTDIFPNNSQVVNYANGTSTVTSYATPNGTSSGVNAPATNAFNLPTDMGIFVARGRRFRPSATVSLQWAPDNETMFYVEGFYQGLRADIRDSQFANLNVRNPINNVPTTINNAVISTENGPTGFPYLESASVNYDPTKYAGNGPNWVAQGRRIELNTVQAAIGGTKTTDDVKLSFDIAYTDSWQIDWQRQMQQYVSVPFTGTYAMNGKDYGAQLGVNFDTGISRTIDFATSSRTTTSFAGIRGRVASMAC